jgi:protein ImuA
MTVFSMPLAATEPARPSPPLNGRAGTLNVLRRAIGGIEGRHIEADAAASLVPFGVPCLDQVLAGGLSRAALHEVAAKGGAEIAAATSFTLTLARRAAQGCAVVWIAEEMALRESGFPYGPGLDEIGFFPEQVLTVAAARVSDTLWAMEEALRSRAVGAVIAEIRRDNAIDAVASRRLSLAALQRGTLALLLRASPDARPLPALTRWVVGAAPARPFPHGPGPPAFVVHLVRNRCGPTGSWMLEWNRGDQRFDLASAHPLSVAQAAADGPPPAADVA